MCKRFLIAAMIAALTAAIIAVTTLPARAQDPLGGALATVAAATVQAQRWQQQAGATRQAQAVEATGQALSFQATAQAQAAAATAQVQAALATAQAQAALATAQAQDAVATAQAQAAEATAQAQGALATIQAQGAAAAATLDAQRVVATAAAYDVALASQARREWAAEAFFYLALVGAGSLLGWGGWRAAKALRAIEARVTRDGHLHGGGVVVDVTPALLTDGGAPPRVRTVDDPGMVQAIGQWFYGEGDDE